MKNEFSITSDLAGQASPLDVFLDAAAGAGFRAIHWCHHWTRDPVFYDEAYAVCVRDMTVERGLRVADVHGYDTAPTADLRADEELYLALNLNRIEFCRRVRAGVLVAHLGARPDEAAEALYARSAERLRAMLPAADAAGVRLAVENLEHTDAFFDRLFAEFAGRGVGFCYDSGHAIVTGQEHLLARHAGLLLATHLHDNDGSGDQHRMPGEGKADWPMIVRTIAESGYAGTVNLEIGLLDGQTSADRCRQAFATINALWQTQ